MKNAWRSRFPIFKYHPELAYLDNAATTQRLDSVLEVMNEFAIKGNANIHRGVYDLSNKATKDYEDVRGKMAGFLNASGEKNIGLTKGTTESINVVARGFLQQRLGEGDNVVVSIMEHHANFLPWQQVCKEMGAELRILEMKSGMLDPNDLELLIDQRTKLVAINHISNTLGRVNAVKEFAKISHAAGVPILIDAAQSAALHGLDVEELECDFLAFSGHKMFGPMGTGVLYVSDDFIEHVVPVHVGGGMIQRVQKQESSYRSFPFSLEAGTPNVQGVLGLGAAVDFLSDLPIRQAQDHVANLTRGCANALEELDGVDTLSFYDVESGIISFSVKDVHAHDVAGFLNRDQIAVRAGVHCTQPLLDELDLAATVRASFSIYNTEQEVDRLIESLKKLIEFWL